MTFLLAVAVKAEFLMEVFSKHAKRQPHRVLELGCDHRALTPAPCKVPHPNALRFFDIRFLVQPNTAQATCNLKQ